MADSKKHDSTKFKEKLCMQGESGETTDPETFEISSEDSMFSCGSCGRVSCDADRLCFPESL